MENILKIIESINNMNNNLCNIVLPDDYSELMRADVDNNVNKDYEPYKNIENFCEYVDNIIPNVTDVKNMYNYDIISENKGRIEEIYNNVQNIISRDIHSQNISNSADYSGFTPNFVDKSENFGDNNYYPSENNDFFHNNSTFKEIYRFVDSIPAHEEHGSRSSNTSNININLGGVTQNITEANCDKVLEELSDMLLRALGGCDGVY